MAKLHTIRRRIKSVKSIHQITKAMELVAASKLRRAQEAALRSRPYALSTRETLSALAAKGVALAHPLFTSRPVRHHTVVLWSSDRGLAGSYNLNLFKKATELLTAATDHIISAIVVGQKGAQFLGRLPRLTLDAVYTNWPSQPTPADIRPIATFLIQQFRQEKTDRVTVIYTDFVSLTRQQTCALPVLPLTPDPASAADPIATDLLFEPSPAVVLDYIAPRLLEVQLYQASLEAAASEHSMRMIAMQNASENSEEINDDLTLAYNSARQSSITQELAEITAGAEATS